MQIRIEDQTYVRDDTHMGKCALGYHGADAAMSPFIHKSMPGWNFDESKQELGEEAGYKLA